MKDLNDDIESPFTLKVSFDKLLKFYETLAESDDEFIALKAKHILSQQKNSPILREGFSDLTLFSTYENEIRTILQDVFPNVLTSNEIKTASVPYHDFVFNTSERFNSIIKNAGEGYQLQIKNLLNSEKYRVACIIILNFYYGFKIDYKRPFYYEIPDEKGIIRTYKILYNIDFTELSSTSAAPKITQQDFEELMEHFEDIELWKAKFPPNSYIFKGFVINNVFEVTDDSAISHIKSSLLVAGKRQDSTFVNDLQMTFESLFNIKNLRVGFVIYNEENQLFERVIGKGIKSYLLADSDFKSCRTVLCERSYGALVRDNSFFSISDVDKYYALHKKEPQYKLLHSQGIKSAILAPIAHDGKLLGVLELVSLKSKELNSVNANRLMDVMPFIVTSVIRSKEEEENLIEAVIQQECTAIHPSVSWKFRTAARKFLVDSQNNNYKATFSEIVFENVYPLFGQIDVKGSSEARNLATKLDLELQLKEVSAIIALLSKAKAGVVTENVTSQLNRFMRKSKADLKVDLEQLVANFLKNDINPLFKICLKTNSPATPKIKAYFKNLNSALELFYVHRKQYDSTISLINEKMSVLIDQKQIEAQKIYPHYYERFKTDGVEHNMYIGESITKEDDFKDYYLYNLRLWQLQVMCDMENEFYHSQEEFPLSLEVTSMILVFNQPLSIRFRMDEKRFDVDGTYNARYEVVKKRVDKAFVKGSQERVTSNGKITIIYSQKVDEKEYIKYIKFLQAKEILGTSVEIVDIEDLQGVTGLKAIRVPILYHTKTNDSAFYSYEDLISEMQR